MPQRSREPLAGHGKQSVFCSLGGWHGACMQWVSATRAFSLELMERHPMKHSIIRPLQLALVSLIALAGGAGMVFGGGGATGTGGPAYSAFGMLSDFGSIFVNGIEFFTDKASITINGVPNRPESDLRIGMVLSVHGSIDGSGRTGNATTVDYHA